MSLSIFPGCERRCIKRRRREVLNQAVLMHRNGTILLCTAFFFITKIQSCLKLEAFLLLLFVSEPRTCSRLSFCCMRRLCSDVSKHRTNGSTQGGVLLVALQRRLQTRRLPIQRQLRKKRGLDMSKAIEDYLLLLLCKHSLAQL